MARAEPARATVHVLTEDLDLGQLIPAEAREHAERTVVAPELCLPRGELTWDVPVERPVLGLLLLSGLLGVRMQIPGRAHLEVLSPGEVGRPWTRLDPEASTPTELTWQAFDHARVAVLDQSFYRAARDLPELHEALAERLVLRARRLNFQLAVNAVVGVEERLLLTLWHFGDRWGQVTADGVRVRLPLTHNDLADVVASSRPSVSSALMALRRQGRVEPYPEGWILRGHAPARLDELKRRAAL